MSETKTNNQELDFQTEEAFQEVLATNPLVYACHIDSKVQPVSIDVLLKSMVVALHRQNRVLQDMLTNLYLWCPTPIFQDERGNFSGMGATLKQWEANRRGR